MALFIAPVLLFGQPALTRIAEFPAPEAGQGVAVDAGHFYAVDNTTIAK